MIDVVDSGTRSRMMAGIRGKDTKPEMVLRRGLHSAGLRYRLHSTSLAGKPDIVFRSRRAVVFVHGCFWHRHEGCRYSTNPATRPEFWKTKFAMNVQRDARSRDALLAEGWRVAIVWECAIRQSSERVLDGVKDWLKSDEATLTIG